MRLSSSFTKKPWRATTAICCMAWRINYVAGDACDTTSNHGKVATLVTITWLRPFMAGFFCSRRIPAQTDPFDQRYRDACDLYNYGLGWALTEKNSTNATAVLTAGLRQCPAGSLDIELSQQSMPWESSRFDKFILADHFLVRGLSTRNRRPGWERHLSA